MKTILFSILILFSINGFAFNWKKVGGNVYGDSYYVDVDSIKKRNGFVYYWELVDALEPVKFSAGNANSVIIKYKVNCVEEKQTRLNNTWYSLSMGIGRIIFEDSPNKILYPKPNTIGYDVLKFVCDYAKQGVIIY